MRSRPVLAAALAVALAAPACTSKAGTSSGGSSGSGATPSASASSGATVTGYHPVIDPANFRGVVDNPWFPLKPGTVAVYKGSKDGQPVRETYTVTKGVQKVDGV